MIEAAIQLCPHVAADIDTAEKALTHELHHEQAYFREAQERADQMLSVLYNDAVLGKYVLRQENDWDLDRGISKPSNTHNELYCLVNICRNLLFAAPPEGADADLTEAELQREEVIRHHRMLYAMRKLHPLVFDEQINPHTRHILKEFHKDITDELCRSHNAGISFPDPNLLSRRRRPDIDSDAEDLLGELAALKRRKFTEAKEEIAKRIKEGASGATTMAGGAELGGVEPAPQSALAEHMVELLEQSRRKEEKKRKKREKREEAALKAAPEAEAKTKVAEVSAATPILAKSLSPPGTPLTPPLVGKSLHERSVSFKSLDIKVPKPPGKSAYTSPPPKAGKSLPERKDTDPIAVKKPGVLDKKGAAATAKLAEPKLGLAKVEFPKLKKRLEKEPALPEVPQSVGSSKSLSKPEKPKINTSPPTVSKKSSEGLVRRLNKLSGKPGTAVAERIQLLNKTSESKKKSDGDLRARIGAQAKHKAEAIDKKEPDAKRMVPKKNEVPLAASVNAKTLTAKLDEFTAKVASKTLAKLGTKSIQKSKLMEAAPQPPKALLSLKEREANSSSQIIIPKIKAGRATIPPTEPRPVVLHGKNHILETADDSARAAKVVNGQSSIKLLEKAQGTSALKKSGSLTGSKPPMIIMTKKV